jgi:exopolysaccharide biosynthesis polyprenyl glycosylphosphotransferase
MTTASTPLPKPIRESVRSAGTPGRSTESEIGSGRTASSFRSTRAQNALRFAFGARALRVRDLTFDSALVFFNAVLVFALRAVSIRQLPHLTAGSYRHRTFELALFEGIFTILILHSSGLYRLAGRPVGRDAAASIAKSVMFALVLCAGLELLSNPHPAKALTLLLYCGLLNALTPTIWRLWFEHAERKRIATGQDTRNVLIVGNSSKSRFVERCLRESREVGYASCGFIDDDAPFGNGNLGSIKDLDRVIRQHFVDEIFITLPYPKDKIDAVVSYARHNHLSVHLVPDLYDGFVDKPQFRYFGYLPSVSVYSEPIPELGLFCKRAMDVVCSFAGLLLLSPLLCIVAVLIKLDSPGPVFYRSTRVGKRGRKFQFLKFRTMVTNADALKESLQHLNERKGLLFKITNDPRVTGVGRVLRKYSIDELPQLVNVLQGDMSLVGPRPPLADEYREYTHEHLPRLAVRPGITGLWQVTARNDPSFATAVVLDQEYIQNWSLWLDFKLMLRTVQIVAEGGGR